MVESGRPLTGLNNITIKIAKIYIYLDNTLIQSNLQKLKTHHLSLLDQGQRVASA